MSYELAKRWMKSQNYGIAFVGYQDENEPGYSLLNSKKDKEFLFGKQKVKRKSHVDSFRFSSHASLEELIDYICEIKPNKLFVVHGETESSENLAVMAQERLPNTKVMIPIVGKSYLLFDKKD